MRRSLVAAVLGFGLVMGAGLMAGDLRAEARAPAAAPPGIATIDIEKVFANLQETADMKMELDIEATKLKGNIQAMKDRVNSLRASAEALAAGKAREEAMEAAVKADMDEQVLERYYAVLLDRRRANMYRVLNDRIIDGCKRLAQKSGFTMVISSDDGVKISDKANSDDAQRIMSLKRFLYVAPEHDVTNDLIKMLNDEHTAPRKP